MLMDRPEAVNTLAALAFSCLFRHEDASSMDQWY